MSRLLLVALFLGVAWFAGRSHAANVQFDASESSDFNVAANWADDNPPTADGDVHFIENGLTANLTGEATVNGVVIGDVSVGVLNVDGGTLNVDVTAGFPQGFSIGGHLNNHTGNGTVNIINGGVVNVNLAGGSPDTGFVGERADGTLNIGPGSALNAPEIVWRIGQFGGFFGGPPPFDAVGIVNVEGSMTGRIMFVGVQGGDSEVTVSGNGSIVLSESLHSSIETFRAERSSIMRLVGSNATWISEDIIANTQNGEPRNHFIFVSDADGISTMVSRDSIFYNNAELTVDLTEYGPMSVGETLLLFDGRPGQLANLGSGEVHQFGQFNLIGADPTGFYTVVYNDDELGDIFLQRLVPEPSSLAMAGVVLAMVAALGRRNHSR